MTSRQPRRGRWVLPIGLGAVLAFSCAACSLFPASGGSSAASPAPSLSGSTSSEVQSRTDLRDEQAIEWTKADVVGDRQVRIQFSMGNPKCYGVRAEVSTTSSAVVVKLVQGVVPDAPEVCTTEAVLASMTVQTDSAIDGRPITQR